MYRGIEVLLLKTYRDAFFIYFLALVQKYVPCFIVAKNTTKYVQNLPQNMSRFAHQLEFRLFGVQFIARVASEAETEFRTLREVRSY